MILTYNGKKNRPVLRDLQELCDMYTYNLKNSLEASATNGEVSFDKDTFTGMTDIISEEHILRSEEEIRDFLKKDAQEKLSKYLWNKRNETPEADCLIMAVLKFIKANDRYPNIDEMRELERLAEDERVAELPADIAVVEVSQMAQKIMDEIMTLAEEILESRLLAKPKDIFYSVESCYDQLNVESGRFIGQIEWNSRYGSGNSSDYHLKGLLLNRKGHTDGVSFYFHHYGTVSVDARDQYDNDIELTTEHMIAIHRSIMDLAELEGIWFTSETDYRELR